MTILDGKKTAQDLKEEIKVAVSEIKKSGKRPPNLAAVLVGDDGVRSICLNKILIGPFLF